MNILLIDDETYAIENINQKLNWEQFQIEEVYTANSVEQAKTLLSILPIQIIISDIVMPGGTGLDLIQWVRDKKYNIQVIFLTSYAEFEYAKQAVLLDSIDYLLKPIQEEKLLDALTRAVEKYNQNKKFEEYKNISEKWDKNKRYIHENFLGELLRNTYCLEEINNMIQLRKLDYKMTDRFLLSTVYIYQNKEVNYWDYKLLKFIFKNAISELIEDINISLEAIIQEKEQMYMFVFKGTIKQEEKLILVFEKFLDFIQDKLKINAWFGMGKSCEIEAISSEIREIQNMYQETFHIKNKILSIYTYERKQSTYREPPLQVWKTLLIGKKLEELYFQIKQYVFGIEITKGILQKLRMDIIQFIYSYLDKQEITAHLLFSDPESENFYKNAVQDIQNMYDFICYFIEKAVKHISYTQETSSVVEKIVQYIDNHYQEEIKRSDLANLVYLNEDYISRIFKKEMGISISQYLIKNRIEIASTLLCSNNLPINTVSIYVGYSNFSYFAKLFKDNTGYSPLEYRRKMIKENESLKQKD